MIGDTDLASGLILEDEEIIGAIAVVGGGIVEAAILCCESAAGRYEQRAEQRVGDVTCSYKTVGEGFRRCADRLRAYGRLGEVYVGGICL